MIDMLSKFGATLVGDARDISVATAIKSLRGQMSCKDDLHVHSIYNRLSVEEKERLERFVIDVVDTALHDFLSFLEGQSDFILAFKENEETLVDLNEVSDGLAGELVTENGWIAKYSDYKSLTEG